MSKIMETNWLAVGIIAFMTLLTVEAVSEQWAEAYKATHACDQMESGNG